MIAVDLLTDVEEVAKVFILNDATGRILLDAFNKEGAYLQDFGKQRFDLFSNFRADIAKLFIIKPRPECRIVLHHHLKIPHVRTGDIMMSDDVASRFVEVLMKGAVLSKHHILSHLWA